MSQGFNGWAVRRAVLALLLSGCAVDVDSGAAHESEQPVASSSFALQASKLVDVFDASIYTLNANIDWSDQGVTFVRRLKSSSTADAIGMLSFSNPDTLAWWPKMDDTYAVKQDYPFSGQTFLAKGVSLYIFGFFGDTKIADTGGSVTGWFATDTSRVYWSDQSGIAKANKSGGGFSRILSTTGAVLYGMEGSQLYFLRYLSGEVQIRKVKTDGTANTLLFSQTNTAMSGLSWDSSFFYWIEHLSSGSWRVRRMAKSGGSATTLRTTANQISQPRPHAGGLFWAEVFTDRSGSDLMSRSSSGTITTLRTVKGSLVSDVFPSGEELYWIQYSPSTNRVELWVGL